MNGQMWLAFSRKRSDWLKLHSLQATASCFLPETTGWHIDGAGHGLKVVSGMGTSSNLSPPP